MSTSISDASADLGHLFRHESGKMAAALVRILGMHNLDLAEDLVQEALCRAVEVWKFGRLPENPAAWLMQTAKNLALDRIRREKTQRKFAPEVGALLETEWTLRGTVDALFEAHEIADDQLRMMFSCCHPTLPHEAQVTLILKILCGFGTREIAHAFLTTEAAVEKRISRAKAVLRRSGLYEVAGKRELRARLEAVWSALYLLFNEGYHSSHPDRAVSEDLCYEALRLALLLDAHPAIAGGPGTCGPTRALVGLMCLHAARLRGRLDANGHLVLLEAQDRTRWDWPLIAKGFSYLARSAPDGELTAFHLEAAIASKHCEAERFDDTDWGGIVELYDRLLNFRPGPVVRLGRAIALAQYEGPERGLEELAHLAGGERLAGYPFLAAAEGELLARLERFEEARTAFERALAGARNSAERDHFRRRIAALE